MDEEVDDRDEAEGERTCQANRAGRVFFYLAGGVLEVGVTDEAPDGLLQVRVRPVQEYENEEGRTLYMAEATS